MENNIIINIKKGIRKKVFLSKKKFISTSMLAFKFMDQMVFFSNGTILLVYLHMALNSKVLHGTIADLVA